MPMLTPTKMVAQIRFLAINCDGEDLCTNPVDQIDVDYTGFVGDSHSGLTRLSCSRVQSQYPKGTRIRNTRQISALSTEELTLIAQTMSIDSLNPAWVGANLVLEGFPDFSKLPPSSRLIAANGTSLVVDMENAPCRFPGEVIEKHLPGAGTLFPRAAMGKRGVTLWVERTGSLSVGDELKLHIPPACLWQMKD